MIARERRRFRHWLDSPEARHLPRKDFSSRMVGMFVPAANASDGIACFKPYEIVVRDCHLMMEQLDSLTPRQRACVHIFGAIPAFKYGFNITKLHCKYPSRFALAPLEVREAAIGITQGIPSVEDL